MRRRRFRAERLRLEELKRAGFFRVYSEDGGGTVEIGDEVDPWLERARCHGDDAARVRELLGTRIANGWLTLDRIAILAGVR